MVYLVTMDQMDMPWVAVDEGCRDAISELAGDITIDYRWDAPTDGKNDVGQMEIINNAVANGADLILMASNGPDTQVATIQEAADKGVKFIYVDSPANFDAYQILATDNVAAGTTAGNAMMEALKAEGIESGDIGVVNVNPATASTMMRENGFRAAFEGTDYNVLESQYGEGQVAMSQEIAVNLITQGVVGIFGTNEGGTTGVGNAIAESSRKVIGVGFDKSDAILEHIRSGNLLCTMAQNPYVMGYEGIKSAAKVLKGEALDAAVLDTGVSVIDAATVDN
ncbi:MAG: substrate-binding domain-containing protein [Gracilibacteraceae bacterium]|jgi:ribose transport system substrate-binding protein|nr:substrate-binding domain-containing protein [Gracilibacteraceae bacterium]